MLQALSGGEDDARISRSTSSSLSRTATRMAFEVRRSHTLDCAEVSGLCQASGSDVRLCVRSAGRYIAIQISLCRLKADRSDGWHECAKPKHRAPSTTEVPAVHAIRILRAFSRQTFAGKRSQSGGSQSANSGRFRRISLHANVCFHEHYCRWTDRASSSSPVRPEKKQPCTSSGLSCLSSSK